MDEQEGWMSVPEVADALQVRQRTVRQFLRERTLLAARRGVNSALFIPQSFLIGNTDGTQSILPALPSTITVLSDAGFSDEEAISWLLEREAELGVAPVTALQRGHIHAVRRVAQTLAL